MYLLDSFTAKNMTLRNRIVMPPMCMYSAGTDGILSGRLKSVLMQLRFMVPMDT